MKKLLSAAVLSLALLAGSAFASGGQYRNYDWNDHRRHARVVRVVHDRGLHLGHYKHRRIRRHHGRRVVIVHYPRRRAHYVYYDRHYRMP